MQVDDSRRPFKAIRSTTRAELSLIIVIVVSFSWSAYALYKIASGNTDTSIFGFNLAKSSTIEQAPRPTTPASLPTRTSTANPVRQNLETVTEDDEQAGEGNSLMDGLAPGLSRSEQLQQLKSEIYKELLKQEREILNKEVLHDQLQRKPSTDSNELVSQAKGPNDLLVQMMHRQQQHHHHHQQQQHPQINFNELSQWRGGFKLPNSSTNLLETNNHAISNKQNHLMQPYLQAASDESNQIHRHPAPSSSSSGSHSNLQLLKDAPSLGQLSARANQKAQLETERRLKNLKKQATTSKGVIGRPTRVDADQKKKETKDTESSEHDNLEEEFERHPSEEFEEEQDLSKSTTTTTTPEPQLTTTTTTTTTTVEPPAEAPSSIDGDEDSSTKSDGDESSSDSENNDDQVSQEEQNENPDNSSLKQQEKPDKMDEESLDRARKTVKAIDEEVDRMTQPSLGSISRHKSDRHQDRFKDIHMDTVHFDDSDTGPTQSDKDHLLKQRSNIPRPRANNGDRKTKLRRELISRSSQIREDEQDPLQVPEISDHKKMSSKPVSSHTDLNISDETKPAYQRRDSRTRRKNRREKRDTSIGLEASPRSDDDDYDGGEDNSIREDEPEGRVEESQPDQEEETQPGSDKEAYQYVTSNDPSLQDLLAHKQLLDSLRLNSLPAPININNNSNWQMSGPAQWNQTQQVPSTNQNQVQTAAGSQGLVDHKPVAADAVYTFDDGILLTPASDDEHEHKTFSKKKMKKKEKKSKKKSTAAMKKGAFKKHKHKKEEKKYHKEKKFKGAKKGKKMSKGKGGKGGKKGSKFYKDKGFKKKGFKNIYVKNEFGQKKSYFDEFRDKDFKKKWKNFDKKYNYAQMKKWQARDVKGAKKMKDQGEKFKKYDKGKWKKKYHKHHESESSKKKKKYDHF